MARTDKEAATAMMRISSYSAGIPLPGSKISHRGFTLLEIMLVLAIIGLASIIVVPNLTGLDARTFSAQVRDATSLLNYARRIAVVNGQPSTATFLVSTQDTEDDDGMRGTSVGHWTSQDTSVMYSDSTDRTVHIDERIDITFYPEGGSTGGTLTLQHDDRSVRIEVDPFTGRVTAFPEED